MADLLFLCFFHGDTQKTQVQEQFFFFWNSEFVDV
jgi:hypothetical protein